MVNKNPVNGIEFFPVEKSIRYLPTIEDINKVIGVAEPDTRDYLITIQHTMGRMSEINRLEWKDVKLDERYVILYTRKKKGGHLTPRKIPMTNKLHEVLNARFQKRDKSKPWVFWHEYTSSKTHKKHCGPYVDRKRIMRRLCELAGVPYFRFHAIRHAGASLMDVSNVPIGSIQRILGHENRTTTEIYLHSLGDTEVKAMGTFEEAQKNSHTQSHT